MKLKKITLWLSPIFLFSNLVVAKDNCDKETFWSTWYNQGGFKGFGIAPSQEKIVKAQYELAEHYYKGNGVTKDYSKALDLFQRAAEGGLTQAHFRLGLINHYGKGKSKDLKEAFNHYQMAAKQNDPEAQFNLGLMYRYGLGTQRNMTQAFSWFEKSANDQLSLNHKQCEIKKPGVLEAQFNLAQMYHYGMGVKKNATLAAVWYDKAATQGMKEAQFNLRWKWRSII